MATTGSIFNLVGFPFPYIGIGLPAAQYITPIPSAELMFVINSGTIVVAGSGEDQALLINCSLPSSFCYVLVESSFFIRGTTIDDWDDNMRCNLRDDDLTPVVLMPIEYSSTGLAHHTTTEFSKTYVAKDIPNKLVVPPTQTAATMQIGGMNPTIDGTAGVISFYARFLRYDRNQAQHWQVNTPVLTR